MTENATSPPYLPFVTFYNTIRSLGEKGLPGRIDASVLGSLSGSNRGLFLAALAWFDFVDPDGVPSSLLQDFAMASEKEWPQKLASLLRHYYPTQLSLLESGTPSQLRESFTSLTGSSREKAMRFLVSAASAAALPVSAHQQRPRQASGNGGRPKQTRKLRKATANMAQAVAPTPAAREGMRTFPIHIPGKPEGQIIIPQTADVEDLPLLEAAFGYVQAVLKANRTKGDDA